MPWVLPGCWINSNLTIMNKQTTQSALTEEVSKKNNQKQLKAKQKFLGIDAHLARNQVSGKQTFAADQNWLKPISLRRDQAFVLPLGVPRPHRWNEGRLESMTNALHSPVAKSRRTISCSNIRWTRGCWRPVGFTMTIFNLPPINATFNGLSTRPIWGGWTSIQRDSERLPLVFLTVMPALRSRFDRRRKMGKIHSPDLALYFCDRRLFHVVPMVSMDSL
jgi:hypothetical protein